MNRDAFEKGLKTRREVLGAEYVDQAIRNADSFNLPLQELVTEY
jgi:4-carboxymuconolactone decarboxylase